VGSKWEIPLSENNRIFDRLSVLAKIHANEQERKFLIYQNVFYT